MAVKLMIVDDRPAISDRLLAMLGGIERVTAVAVARTLHEAKQKCRSYRPDVVVLDLQLPDGNGLETIHTIKSGCTGTQVFVFSNHLEYRSKALAAGADRFFDKSLEFEPLIECLAELEDQSQSCHQEGGQP